MARARFADGARTGALDCGQRSGMPIPSAARAHYGHYTRSMPIVGDNFPCRTPLEVARRLVHLHAASGKAVRRVSRLS